MTSWNIIYQEIPEPHRSQFAMLIDKIKMLERKVVKLEKDLINKDTFIELALKK